MEKIKFLTIGLIGSLLIALTTSQNIDRTGFIGCFVNDKEKNEFRTYASHLDLNSLTPQLCVDACSVMGQSLAAIEEGNFCFCKSSEGTNLVNTTDSDCLALSCPGDPSLACGSQNNLMIYKSLSSTQIKSVNLVNTENMVDIFSQITFKIEFSGYPENLFVVDGNNMVGNYDMKDHVSNENNYTFYLTHTEAESIELIVAQFDINSEKGDATVLKIPTVNDALSEPTMSCPTEVLDIDQVTCDVKYVSGGKVQGTVNFGDGSSDSIETLDYNLVRYGVPVPKSLKEKSSFSMTATNEYLIANSEVFTEGYLRAIEIFSIQTVPTVDLNVKYFL
ncbi:WSC domain-containing 2 [Brachionus plicatilis]|uniref:WSC domain-containing 2 n=1 Tax=Brachionus plicatilis TaxID=10195 RepID=A0A3M7QKD4_BRAPC|nr:WSC domain-containing 2 [Brachionus plicatilis]